MTVSSPTAVYLFAGNSLTEGIYGESYVQRVADSLQQGRAGLRGEAVNLGRGCDTAQSLLNRIDGPLRQHRPEWVILAVGGNDVWLPWLSTHSFVWRLWFLYRRITRGQVPTTDLDQFAALYRALIDKARQSGARALACTISPLGERLSSPVNQRLARLNGVIKHVSTDCQVPVADVWQAFVEELATSANPAGYVPGEWLFAWLDRRRLRTDQPDQVAQRRRLQLTFDGIHLNSRGADLWANTILAALARAQGTAMPVPPGAVCRLGLPCFEQGPVRVCYTPGWDVRAHDLAGLVANAYQHLASLTAVQPNVCLAVLNTVHWTQSGGLHAYPAPAALWDGQVGTLLVPDAYTEPYLRDLHLPETVAASTGWPLSLADLGEPARATALSDLLTVQELATLFLRELRVAPADPALSMLLAAYLAQVALHAREGKEAAEMATLWNAWGETLARAGIEEGQRRLQARALFQQHGEGLVASFAGRPSSIRDRVTASLATTTPPHS
jgi:lysophospholipase L1-like esterase